MLPYLPQESKRKIEFSSAAAYIKNGENASFTTAIKGCKNELVRILLGKDSSNFGSIFKS